MADQALRDVSFWRKADITATARRIAKAIFFIVVSSTRSQVVLRATWLLMIRAEYDLAQSQCCDTQQTTERDLDLDQRNAMPAKVYFFGVLGA
jgi:hypothetical protein